MIGGDPCLVAGSGGDANEIREEPCTRPEIDADSHLPVAEHVGSMQDVVDSVDDDSGDAPAQFRDRVGVVAECLGVGDVPVGNPLLRPELPPSAFLGTGGSDVLGEVTR